MAVVSKQVQARVDTALASLALTYDVRVGCDDHGEAADDSNLNLYVKLVEAVVRAVEENEPGSVVVLPVVPPTAPYVRYLLIVPAA